MNRSSGGEIQGIVPFPAVDMYPRGRGLYIYKIKINKCSNSSLIGKTVWVDGRDVFNIR